MDAPIKSIVGTNPFNEIVPGNFTFIESEVIVQKNLPEDQGY